ncbi:MAG: peptidase M23 [Sphingobium sp.]|nr:peptidase M23 [Sphingobium sp.]
MVTIDKRQLANAVSQFRASFRTRDFIFHDGRDLRRFSIAGRTQAALAGVAGITLCFSAYGVVHAAAGAVQMTGALGSPQSPEAKLNALQRELASMQVKVSRIKRAAEVHAARIEQRQALIAAVLSGARNTQLALNTPTLDAETASAAADVVAPLKRAEARQAALAVRVRHVAEQRYQRTADHFRRLGIAPERIIAQGGVGGPYEPVSASTQTVTEANADAQFRSLFMTWKKLETLEKAVIAVPATQPVTNVTFSSLFGVRSDPFRGTAAMHAGVDIPGAIGTPIYATADGIVGRAERAGGYGNLVEINHGRGISTRYGHLSKILVTPNTRVTRGQLIALMGSTGRSTGSHLHYEVRIDGQAVNPMPFLQTADFLSPAREVKPVQVVAGPTDSAN